MTTPPRSQAGPRKALATLALLLCLQLLTACGRDDGPRFDPLPPDAVVLVIGDSLVSGTGARQGEGWPERLADATGWRVINAGVPGNTSADARQRLPGLLEAHKPQAVVIAIGGNDFLRNATPAETRANLDEMIRRSRDLTEHVALVGIPQKSMGAALIGNLSDHALYDELAAEHGLALIADAISEALSDPNLRADRIHANADGYALISQRIIASLDRHGWLAH